VQTPGAAVWAAIQVDLLALRTRSAARHRPNSQVGCSTHFHLNRSVEPACSAKRSTACLI